MIKIGGVNIDISHPKAFAQRMRDNCVDMKYEYIFNEGFRGEEEVDWFVKNFNLSGKVDKIEDMVDKVDIGFIQACNWEKHVDIGCFSKGCFRKKPIERGLSTVI